MAKSTWTFLKGEKRVGEYEELTVRSIGHWGLHEGSLKTVDGPIWSHIPVENYHLFSETGVGMTESTKLSIHDYGCYRDPYKLTYRSYTLQQDGEEKKLDAVFEGARISNSFERINSSLSPILEKYIPGLRHYFWGTAMIALYASTYTPSSPAMNTLMYQVFDSMRHAQHLVELSWEINHAKDIKVDSHNAWLNGAEFQPLRKYIEYGMSTFDWGENMVLINFILNPIFQPLNKIIMVDIPERAGDWVIPQFWLRLLEDIKRHVVCGEEFVKTMIKENEENRGVLQSWIDEWYWKAVDVIDGFRPLIQESNGNGYERTFLEIKDEILTNYLEKLESYGLTEPKKRGVEIVG
jgi:1,2-phenylacetyl-CoA epoxidase catalytic subunit